MDKVFKYFLIPFVLSFIILDLVSGILYTPFSVIIRLFIPLRATASNGLLEVLPLLVTNLVTYIIIVSYCFLNYRHRRLLLVAVVTGPIFLSILQWIGLYIFLVKVLSLSGLQR